MKGGLPSGFGGPQELSTDPTADNQLYWLSNGISQ